MIRGNFVFTADFFLKHCEFLRNIATISKSSDIYWKSEFFEEIIEYNAKNSSHNLCGGKNRYILRKINTFRYYETFFKAN